MVSDDVKPVPWKYNWAFCWRIPFSFTTRAALLQREIAPAPAPNLAAPSPPKRDTNRRTPTWLVFQTFVKLTQARGSTFSYTALVMTFFNITLRACMVRISAIPNRETESECSRCKQGISKITAVRIATSKEWRGARFLNNVKRMKITNQYLLLVIFRWLQVHSKIYCRIRKHIEVRQLEQFLSNNWPNYQAPCWLDLDERVDTKRYLM